MESNARVNPIISNKSYLYSFNLISLLILLKLIIIKKYLMVNSLII